jgi:hypothetical protein
MSLHHLLLAKEYLDRASSDIRSRAPFTPGFAVSALQDAVEMMLFAAAGKLGVSPAKDFDGSWSAVDAKLPDGEKLPYRGQLAELNRARVAFKHYGTVPNLDEVSRLRASADAFLFEVCSKILRIDLNTISELDLLIDEPVKGRLAEALDRIRSDDIEGALQRCSDALEAIRDRTWPLYSTGVNVEFNNVPIEVRREIQLQIGNLREQVRNVADLSLAALFGINLVDIRLMESLLPTKRGGEYIIDPPRVFQIAPVNVYRCIGVLTRYAIAVDRYWDSGQHPDWMPL